MENLFDSIEFFSALGEKILLGDIVKWSTSGMRIFGRVENVENGKLVIKTIGGLYDTEDEKNLLLKKAKPIYKISNSRRLFRMHKKVA